MLALEELKAAYGLRAQRWRESGMRRDWRGRWVECRPHRALCVRRYLQSYWQPLNDTIRFKY